MTNLLDPLHMVIRLAATMPDPRAMLLGIRAADPSRFGGGGATDGLPFRLDMVLDFADTETGDARGIRTRTGVQDWAATWAHSWWSWADDRNPKPAGDSLAWLATHLAWAETHYPAMEEFAEELAHVLRVLEHAHGLDPIPTDRTCPSCGGMLQHRVTSAGVASEFDCSDCGNQYSPDGLELMTDTRIKESDQWVPRDVAAKLLGVSRHRIRVWVNRGQLEDRAGRISVSQARTLMRVALRCT